MRGGECRAVSYWFLYKLAIIYYVGELLLSGAVYKCLFYEATIAAFDWYVGYYNVNVLAWISAEPIETVTL